MVELTILNDTLQILFKDVCSTESSRNLMDKGGNGSRVDLQVPRVFR